MDKSFKKQVQNLLSKKNGAIPTIYDVDPLDNAVKVVPFDPIKHKGTNHINFT